MELCIICGSNEAQDNGICTNCNLYQKTLKRVCSNCKRELPYSMFYTDRDKWDGYKLTCKDCYKQYYLRRMVRQSGKE